jgi:hypothetical protein
LPSTSNGFRYPAATVPPDIPGDIYNLATDVNNYVTSATWTPAYGGDSGATLGSGGSTKGTVFRSGKLITYVGRVAFGAGGVFGGAVLTSINQFGALDLDLSFGEGWYHPDAASSIAAQDIRILPRAASDFAVTTRGSGLPGLNTLGTPHQGDQFHFILRGVLA